jgi:hypothetical protein
MTTTSYVDSTTLNTTKPLIVTDIKYGETNSHYCREPSEFVDHRDR